MRTSNWILCLWGLGLITVACIDERPIYVDTGAAGTTGTGGTTGVAGTGFVTGVAGVTGAAGRSDAAGTGGTLLTGCPEVEQVFVAHSCALGNVCHDAKGTSANFSLGGLDFNDIAGWKRRLVGQYPKGGGTSLCGGSPLPYLVPGSLPAQGLLLSKLRYSNPVCGDKMPSIPPDLTPAEIDCVQRWANEITTSDLPVACTISCPANSYCRNITGAESSPGSFSCAPLPASCNGTPSCACVPSCFRCQEGADFIRCLAAA